MDDKTLIKLERFLNSAFEEAEVSLQFKVNKLYSEGKLNNEEVTLLTRCILEAENPWVDLLGDGEDEDENDG